MDESQLESQGYSFDDLFRGWAMLIEGTMPAFCLSYGPPEMTKMGIQYRARMC